ncbi:hypothetical protein ACJX0J_029395, partial [Zea mays]
RISKERRSQGLNQRQIYLTEPNKENTFHVTKVIHKELTGGVTIKKKKKETINFSSNRYHNTVWKKSILKKSSEKNR